MSNFQEIDFSHAVIAIMDAVTLSDNVTLEERKLVHSLLLKAKAVSKPIECPHCGSDNCSMSDHQPLAMDSYLLPEAQYDNELYSQFECHNCMETFQKVLEISHQ
jgi:hypothetical protein